MTARLGNVLYWAGCAIAGLIALGCIAVGFSGRDDSTITALLLFAPAVVVYLIGRALRYILAGT